MPQGFDPGTGYEFLSRDTSVLFRRWGGKLQLRSLSNAVVPVAVVDEYRSDEAASFYVLSAETPGANNEYPAIMFGPEPASVTAPPTEIEILSLQVWAFLSSGVQFTGAGEIHLWTPFVPYNPVANLNPPGFFIASGTWDRKVTLGHGIAAGGSNPALDGKLGFVIQQFNRQWLIGQKALANAIPTGMTRAPIPLRLTPDAALGIQLRIRNAGSAMGLGASVAYVERPLYT